MRCLLICPKIPKTFWSFESVLKLVGPKVTLRSLGLVTIATLFSESWEFALVERNIRSVSEQEREWADIILFSAMVVQRQDLFEQVREAKQRAKKAVVGGP